MHARPGCQRYVDCLGWDRRGRVQAMDIELETSVVHCLYDSMDELVETASDGLISEATMLEIFKRVSSQVSLLVSARADRETQADEDDLDEEDLEQLKEVEEEEDALLEQVRPAL